MMTASRNCRLAILCSQAAGVLSVRSRIEREFRRKFFRYGCRGTRTCSWSASQTRGVRDCRLLSLFRAGLCNVSARAGCQPKQAATFLEVILRRLRRPVALQFGCLGPTPALRQRKTKFAVLTQTIAGKPKNLPFHTAHVSPALSATLTIGGTPQLSDID